MSVYVAGIRLNFRKMLKMKWVAKFCLLALSLHSCVLLPDLGINSGQVIVHDASSQSSFFIDIDADGENEFYVVHQLETCSGGGSVFIESYGSGGSEPDSLNYVLSEIRFHVGGSILVVPKLLNYNDISMPSAQLGEWSDIAIVYSYITCDYGVFDFFNQFEATKYVAVKFLIQDRYHYGWIEYDGNGDITRTAYNTVPGEPYKLLHF